MPMAPIPEQYTVGLPVVRLAPRGNVTLIGTVTRVTKTRLTAVFTRPGMEDLTCQFYSRGWNSDPLLLTEHGNSTVMWGNTATLVPADDPRVYGAQRKAKDAKLAADIRAAARGFFDGPITPDKARVLRFALTAYITQAEELHNA